MGLKKAISNDKNAQWVSSLCRNLLRPRAEELGLPWWIRQQGNYLQCQRPRFDPWVGKIPWRREWQLSPVFRPGECHGQRNLAGYSPWGCKESDMTNTFSSLFHLCRWGDRLSDSSEELLQTGWGWEGQQIMWFWRRVTCRQAHILVEGYYWSPGTGISVTNFSVFLSVGRCKSPDSWNFLLKLSHYLRACSACFLRAQSNSLLIFALNSSPGVL